MLNADKVCKVHLERSIPKGERSGVTLSQLLQKIETTLESGVCERHDSFLASENLLNLICLSQSLSVSLPAKKSDF